MEYFENAHVGKKGDCLNKDSKSKTNMKKQLKQMLHGYKHNDNKTIRDSVTKPVDLEDPFNVSTFSEANLKVSSINVLQEEPIIELSSMNSENTKSMVENNPLTQESVDCNSSGTILSDNEESTTSVLDGFSSDNTSSIEIGSETEPFDVNGELASKILKKLNNLQKKNKKRKFEDIEKSQSHAEDLVKNDCMFQESRNRKKNASIKKVKLNLDASSDEEEIRKYSFEEMSGCSKHLEGNKKRVKKTELKKKILQDNSSDTIEEEEVQELLLDQAASSLISTEILAFEKHKQLSKPERSNSVNQYEECSDISNPQTPDKESDNSSSDSRNVYSPSSPFVSYKASDSVYYKGFNDLLKDYKYPTMKNIPTEIPVFSVKSTQMFHCDHENEAAFTEDPFVEVLDDASLIDSSNDENVQFSPDTVKNSPVESKGVIESNETLQDKTIEEVSLLESSQLNFSNPVKVYHVKNSFIFVIQHPAELFFHGAIKVIPLGGTVDVFGHTLKNPCNIYAPYTNYAHCLKTIQCDNSYYGLFGKLTATGMAVAETEDIVTTLGEYDVVLQLQPLKSHKIDFIENNFNLTNLFNKGNKTIEESLKQASEALGCSFYLKIPSNIFKEVVTWCPALKCGSNPQSRGIVCGGKGTGKSTFLRYYVNRLLARGPVLVIDLDPGQCEFTVAGNISAVVVKEPLLGPNFTHLQKPDRMLNVGIINVMDNLSRYAAAVNDLISYCCNDEKYRNMPWIVNTMGMCNTLGFKLICLIILHLKPTFLLQLDSKNVKKRFESYVNPHTVKTKYYTEFQEDRLFMNVACPENLEYAFYVSEQFTTETTGKKNNFCLAPRDERYLNFLSYFGELLNKHAGVGFLGIIPYEVPLQSLKIGTNVKLDEKTVNKVINGKIIALCQQTAPHHSTKKLFTLDDKPLLCHGHGLIRGIDCEKGLFYIITPSSLDKLSLVDTLVYADWVPELRGQERVLPEGTVVPYRMPTLRQQKQLMFVPRRRFNILQFLKMSRNPI